AKAKSKALERARALEKAGQPGAAAEAFREAGAVDEAARALGAAKRPAEAARLLLDALGVHPAQVGQLDPAGKKRALMAAILFAKAGDVSSAMPLFVTLGKNTRAIDALRRAGDQVGAARLEGMGSEQLQT